MPHHSPPPLTSISEDRIDRIKELFVDIRATLGLGWVGELFESLAVYDLYLQAAWFQLKPSVSSAYFARVVCSLRERAADAFVASNMPVSDHRRALQGAPEREPAKLAAVLELLEQLNPATLVITSAVRDALLGREVGSSPPRTGPDAVPVPPASSPVVRFSVGVDQTMAQGGATGGTLPGREYVLFAQWPAYLEIARRELRPLLRSDAYVRGMAELDAYATASVRALPYPFRANGELARSLGYAPGDVSALLDTVTELQRRLCGLTLQIAALRAGWDGGNIDGA